MSARHAPCLLIPRSFPVIARRTIGGPTLAALATVTP